MDLPAGKSKLQYNQSMLRFAFLILIVSSFCACHNSPKAATIKKESPPKTAKTQTRPEAEYVGDNTAPVEIRALKDATQLQKDLNKKQEAEKEILKQRD